MQYARSIPLYSPFCFDPTKVVLPPSVQSHMKLDAQSPAAPQNRKRKRDDSLRPGAELSLRSRRPDFYNGEYTAKLMYGRNRELVAAKQPVTLYPDRQQLVEALRECFQQKHDVDFAGSYHMHDPGVSHKQRIQIITHEIWKATGYRFTVKDHPRTKHGHKTRLWCSQDEAHRSKSSKTCVRPRTSSTGEALAKARYPCRSGLLISSRDEGQPDLRIIIIRIHHHDAHEPYYDASLPPEMTQSIWETMGWRHNNHPPLPAGASDRGADGASEGGYSEDEGSPDLLRGNNKEPGSRGRLPAPPLDPGAIVLDPERYQERMRRHIETIRDFCDGLEYQLPFNDYRMLEVLETEGAQFLRLVQDCLKKEGRLGSHAGGNVIATETNGGIRNIRSAIIPS